MVTKQWPVFQKYGVLGIEALVEHCLESLLGLTVEEQLHRQKVVRVVQRPLVTCGGILFHDLNNPTHGFDVVLNDVNSEEQNIETLGHELGHTFQCCCDAVWFTDLTELFRKGEWYDTAETFARLFAEKWLLGSGNCEQAADFIKHL